MSFLNKVEAVSKADEKEILKFLGGSNRFRHMSLADLKPFPKINAYYTKVVKDLTSSVISLDEARGTFGYTDGEVIEAVFGTDAYNQYCGRGKK